MSTAQSDLPVVFLGPSMPVAEARSILEAEYRPPCRRGDLDGYGEGTVVAIIDGVFDQSLSVSPREIVGAIRRGANVFGAASMGALRAAEVPMMTGVGHIYDLYRRGVIESDDEVALLFDPDRLVPVTVPLVNVRYAAQRVAMSGTVVQSTADLIVDAAKRLHYSLRTWEHIIHEAGLGGKADASELTMLLRGIDLKHDDAKVLLERLALQRLELPPAPKVIATAALPAVPRPSADQVPVGIRPLPPDTVLLWETGDEVSLPFLLDFMKVTGRIMPFACNVLTRLLFEGKLSLLCPEGGRRRPIKNHLYERFAAWGWNTSEESQVTANDLGLDVRDVVRHLRAEAGMAEALRALLARTSDATVMEAMRSELFANDIALKREVMICASVRALAAGQTAVAEPSLQEARHVLCRLHGCASWTSLEAALLSMGLAPERTADFVHNVARAIQFLHTSRATKDGDSDESRERRWREVDARFGLVSSVKGAGETRFATRMADAYEHSQRLKDIIGVSRVALINALTDMECVYVSQAARPQGAWSSTYGSGKSDSREGAIVGGIMEETEKWAQERFTGDPVVDTYESLSCREEVLDPVTLDLPYDSRYRPSMPIAWQRCVDLMSGGNMFAPLAALATPQMGGMNNVYYSPRAGRVVFSTNGLASGFSLAEAVVHAMCEVIERHAMRISELYVSNPGLRGGEYWPRAVDTRSASDRTVQVVRDLESKQYSVRLWDITADVDVPTLYARISRDGVVWTGWATHPDPAVAVHCALLEACQTRIGNVAGGREDLTIQARSLGRHERSKPRRMAAEIFWDHGAHPTRRVSDIAGVVASDVYVEACWIRERLRAAGVRRILAVNLSVLEITPAHVVRVVIPGLETNSPFHCGPRARRILAADVLR